jgi:TPR repeat protein
VRKDFQEAAKWNRQAAEQGDLEAQNNLGMQYENGEGVAQSFTEASRWYRRAADAGSDLAQTSLGVLYFRGNGVTQSYEEAAKWWRLAAAQGHAIAQFNLGLLYKDGQGVPQDNVQALKWMILSGNRDFEYARSLAEQLRGKMTAVQISQAEKLAEEWTPAQRPSKGEPASMPRAGGKR